MEIGMVGLGRMGANMSRRLMADGHRCVVYDVNPNAINALAAQVNEAARTHEIIFAADRSAATGKPVKV